MIGHRQPCSKETASSPAKLLVPPATPRRIPALDGWRGIAILLVIFEHLQWSKFGHPLARWTETGQHGVTIFFVLSGFLITSKLMGEDRSLKQFYIRRFFRLMPAAWLYLAVTLALHKFAGAQMYPRKELFGCLFFYRNYVVQGTITQHFWSLSLEEQFYLLWPFLLLLIGTRRAKWFVFSLACAIAIWRASHWTWYNRIPFNFRSEVRADALLVGCALALLLAGSRARGLIVRSSRILVLPALVSVLVCTAAFAYLPPLVEDLSIAILIAGSVIYPQSMAARILAWRPLSWLGMVSYSIYLWQGLLALRGWSWFGSFYLMVLAVGSFYYIEKPCINLGSRLLARNTAANSPRDEIARSLR